MSDENEILFNRWVLVPLEALRAVPAGDGAFGALAMSFGLYERFLSSRIHSRGESATDGARYEEASKDFDGQVSPQDFKSFWEMYRVGMQHFFHPKHFVKGADKTRWGWDISEGPEYRPYPVVQQKENDLFIIAINPWAFAYHVVNRWKEFPELMNELSATKLGEVRPTPAPIPAETHYSTWTSPAQSTYTESPIPRNYPSTGKWPG